jgi:hypothetical protein
MIYSFTVTFGAKYLTGMFTSVPPYETFSLIKINHHKKAMDENEKLLADLKRSNNHARVCCNYSSPPLEGHFH